MVSLPEERCNFRESYLNRRYRYFESRCYLVLLSVVLRAEKRMRVNKKIRGAVPRPPHRPQPGG